MNWINSKIEELRAQFGQDRVQLVSDETGTRSQVVILHKPELLMDKASWSNKEYGEIPEALKATHKTRIVPIRGIVEIGSVPLSGTQALGIKRAGNNGRTAELNFIQVKHHTYITFFDNVAKPMSAEEIMQSQFGSIEAFHQCSFISFETLDAKIALGPVGMYRLSIAKSEEERYAILNGALKQAYETVTDATGKVTRTDKLVRVTYGPQKQQVYKGLVFVDAPIATAADGTALSAFETYRCGTDIETGALTYERGTYAQLERNVTTVKSADDIIGGFNKHLALRGATTMPGSKPMEHSMNPPADNEPTEFNIETAKKADLVKFLVSKGAGTMQSLASLKVDDLRTQATELLLMEE